MLIYFVQIQGLSAGFLGLVDSLKLVFVGGGKSVKNP